MKKHSFILFFFKNNKIVSKHQQTLLTPDDCDELTAYNLMLDNNYKLLKDKIIINEKTKTLELGWELTIASNKLDNNIKIQEYSIDYNRNRLKLKLKENNEH